MPEAQQREDKRKQASRYLVFNVSQQSFDSYETRTLQERCLVWRHEGPPMTPPAYNDMLQIFQTPEHVAILQEMSNNDVRIIPLDGRPHLPSTRSRRAGSTAASWREGRCAAGARAGRASSATPTPTTSAMMSLPVRRGT